MITCANSNADFVCIIDFDLALIPGFCQENKQIGDKTMSVERLGIS